MTRATFADITSALVRASVPVRELHGSGHVAVIPTAGRVIALAFSRDGPNLLWSNPDLSKTELVRNQLAKLVGGLGGDRLWFAPELDYHWKGVPHWDTVENYEVPVASDPGAYQFSDESGSAISLRSVGELPNLNNGQRVGFEIRRTIRLVPSPLKENDTLRLESDYVGVETSHVLKFDDDTTTGRLDLWHLLQIPVGSVLIVPLKKTAPDATKAPLSYALPGSWIGKSDRLLWRYGGTAQAKIGLSSRALTGRTAVLQQFESEYCLLIRQFVVDASAPYTDHPYGNPRTDQAFQAWDGMGFGEMEYHSPMIDAQDGPRTLTESDQLWAFAGSISVIRAVAEQLLERDIADAFAMLNQPI